MKQFILRFILLCNFIPVSLFACDIPTGITISGITQSSALISWNADPFATMFNVKYSSEDSSVFYFIRSNSDSALLSSLQPGTAYNIEVQAICGSDTSQFSKPEKFTTLLPAPDHIVICIFENKDFNEIVNSPSAPFINSILQDSSSALFTQSFAIQHPSFPNYLDLFSGSDQGVSKDTCLL